MSRAGMNRWNARRDANEKGIVDALEALGCKVIRHKAYDLEVLHKASGRRWMVDVKGEKGTLTKSQQALIASGWPLVIWRTVQHAIDAVTTHEELARGGNREMCGGFQSAASQGEGLPEGSCRKERKRWA